MEAQLINNDFEIETGNDEVKIEVPFDPNDITINIVQQSIGQIIELLEYGDILIPKFQRLPNLWSEKKKSRFIESLILGLPIPLFYFDEGEDKKWRVIDGLQRISTLEHFILGNKKNVKNLTGNLEPLVLKNLEFLSEYNGKTWDELHRDIKKRISLSQITINLIGKGTPEFVKYNIFSRINQNSMQLEAQEIRTALFQGYRMDFIEELVKPNSEEGMAFIKATNSSVKATRQGDLDIATRFLAFYILDYKTYEPDLDSFLTKGTKAIPEKSEVQNDIKKRFKDAMDLAFLIFGDDAFRKRTDYSESRKPINKAIFEVISTVFARLTEKEIEIVKNNKENLKSTFLELQKNNKEFWNAITNSTASKENVLTRHTKFISMINNFLNDKISKNKEFQIA